MKNSETKGVTSEVLAPDKRNGELSPTHLIEMAIGANANVEQLEKLMELQLKWDANKARKQFFESLSAFQNDMPVVTKNKTVDYTGSTGKRTKYSYATLDNIIAEIKHHLNNHGLSYRWEFDDSTKIEVKCIITHTAGHSESSTMSSNIDNTPGKNDIQSRGSALTYLQRYTLIGALGIGTAQDDTDAVDVKAETPLQNIKKSTAKSNDEYLKEISAIKDRDILTQYWNSNKQMQNAQFFSDAVKKQSELIKEGKA